MSSNATIALYRKYRCTKLQDIIGQNHIVEPISNALKSGSLSHAYLFTGPHGVGKTSIARIIAHDANGFEYDGSSYLDIIEIDAASNRRIDEIRDLREKVHIAPAKGTYKVYIIDEVHMLTREAFNALLKTLEEPPAHALFILATTEAHKIPATIISRAQRHTFHLIPFETLQKHLSVVAKEENISIDEDAIALIAKHAEGSSRDSLSLLDQVSAISSGAITASDIKNMLGIANEEIIEQLLESTVSGNIKDVLTHMEKIKKSGTSPRRAANQLIDHIQETIYSKNTKQQQMLVSLIGSLLEVPSSSRPQTQMLLSLLSVAVSQNNESNQSSKVARLSPVAAEIDKKLDQTSKVAPLQQKSDVKSVSAPPEPSEAGSKSSTPMEVVTSAEKNNETSDEPKTNHAAQIIAAEDTEVWESFLKTISNERSLHATLRMAQYSIQENEVILRFRFPIHQKRISEKSTAAKVSELLSAHIGKQVTVTATIDKSLLAPKPIQKDKEIFPQQTQTPTQKAPVDEPTAAAQLVIDTLGGEVISL